MNEILRTRCKTYPEGDCPNTLISISTLRYMKEDMKGLRGDFKAWQKEFTTEIKAVHKRVDKIMWAVLGVLLAVVFEIIKEYIIIAPK